MIVICTKCEAKFRVADERFGARGANVRCSRCKNVFFVQPGAAPGAAARPAPPPALAVDLEPAAAGSENPFVSDPIRASSSVKPPPLPPAAAAPSAADPFAAFAASAPRAEPAAPPSPATSLADIPEADPADLLAVAAGSGDAEDAATDEPTTGGLALEERRTPTPAPAALRGKGERFPGAAGDPGAFDAGNLAGDEPLALATEPTIPPTPLGEPAPPAQEAPAPPAPAPARREPESRVPGARGSGLRAAAVNAVALAALLAAALAILVVWRSEGRVEAASLRPAAILARLRGSDAQGPFTTRDVRSGLYERERAPPVLFVRGEVVSRAATAVRQVRVAVELLRDGRVIARGEALAGAIPTAEALHRAADAAALAAVAREAAARAPAQLAPGAAVPFLVAIADHPADLEGASLRVEVVAGGDAP